VSVQRYYEKTWILTVLGISTSLRIFLAWNTNGVLKTVSVNVIAMRPVAGSGMETIPRGSVTYILYWKSF